MTDHTDLLEQPFELNLNNYGTEDVERLNDWAINAYAALGALQAEVERLTTLARGQHIELYNARLQLAAAQGQEPVDAVPLSDMVEGSHPSYGRGLFATDNCVKQFYAAPILQPPTPGDTAITYMTGYSDGREWAKPSQALVVEPVYQYQLANGNWIDQTKESYDYNVKHGQATVRMLYATPQAAPLYAKEQQ